MVVGVRDSSGRVLTRFNAADVQWRCQVRLTLPPPIDPWETIGFWGSRAAAHIGRNNSDRAWRRMLGKQRVGHVKE